MRHAHQAPIVLAVFVLTQVLDGTLTYWGVTKFGLAVESNAYLLSLSSPYQVQVMFSRVRLPS